VPLARSLRELSRSVVLGYVNHKEDAIEQPRRWFDAVAAEYPRSWEDLGLRLLAISAEADVAGDNRLSLDVDASVACAAICSGAGSLSCLDDIVGSNGRRWFDGRSKHWAAGFITALPKLTLTGKELASVWSFSIGSLSWMFDEDIRLLADVRYELEAIAVRLGLSLEIERIAAATPLEWKYAAADDKGAWRSARPIPRERSPQEALLEAAIVASAPTAVLPKLLEMLGTHVSVHECWPAVKAGHPEDRRHRRS